MRKLWPILGACLVAGASYGCATDEQAGAAAANSEPRSRPSYITGSRLPTADSAGTSSVSQTSRDDYIDERNRMVNPMGGK